MNNSDEPTIGDAALGELLPALSLEDDLVMAYFRENPEHWLWPNQPREPSDFRQADELPPVQFTDDQFTEAQGHEAEEEDFSFLLDEVANFKLNADARLKRINVEEGQYVLRE